MNLSTTKDKILYICPSDEWGTRERGVLRDCKISLNNGYETYLFCYRDSFLDLKAKELGVQTYYYHGKTKYNFFKWYKFKGIRQLIDEKEITLVHCYIIDLLWPLSYLLRRNFRLPMVFSQSVDIKKPYRDIWNSVLIRRLDMMILTSQEILENININLGLPKRKMSFCGLGINTDFEPLEEKRMQNILAQKKQKWVGIWTPPHLKSIKTLKPLLNATVAQNNLAEGKESVRLFLFCEKNWNQNYIFPELQAFTKKLKIEDSVVFAHMLPETEDFSIFIEEGLTFGKCGSLEKVQKYLDVWASTEDTDIFEDYSITALINKVPILVPRVEVTSEMRRKHGLIGETYKIGDAREMREKLEVIFENSKSYVTRIARIKKTLIEAYGEESYEKNLLKQYAKVWKRRERFYQRKKRH